MKQITLEKKIVETKRLLNLAEDAVTQQISYMYYEFYAYEANRLFDYMNQKIKAQNKKIDDLEKENKNPRELSDDEVIERYRELARKGY